MLHFDGRVPLIMQADGTMVTCSPGASAFFACNHDLAASMFAQGFDHPADLLVDRFISVNCPFLCASLRVPYLEWKLLFESNHRANNMEDEWIELSHLFTRVLGTAHTVVGATYLILSLKVTIQTLAGKNAPVHQNITDIPTIRRIAQASNLPFFVVCPNGEIPTVFGCEGASTVFCAASFRSNSELGVVCEALARLIHVRLGVPEANAMEQAQMELRAVSSHNYRKWAHANCGFQLFQLSEVVLPTGRLLNCSLADIQQLQAEGERLLPTVHENIDPNLEVGLLVLPHVSNSLLHLDLTPQQLQSQLAARVHDIVSVGGSGPAAAEIPQLLQQPFHGLASMAENVESGIIGEVRR